jgi:hypothetical protein
MTVTHLGSFGTVAEDVEITFDYFGQVIHVNPSLGELDYVDFLASAGAMEVESVASVGVVKDFTRMCIAPEDFDTFWSTAKAQRQGVEQLFEVLKVVVEATSDRPTVRPSSSSATPTSDATSFVLPRRVQGRPDLELLIHKQQADQAAEAG